ncbi:Hypothetical protein PENO1_045630 [Penicillium occitanis (nom. inval.)]|nr:Hypothetical protein PENO1_045630 [Penicillium occitanis (nom. inval.)]PCH01646.1 hypothetical protein PENOC_047030 [Penicillium occitanis (nom. inval.)]
MLSMMDGIVADMQTVMKFLESYVDGLFVPTAYIATGLSLGGHVTWDILAEDPRIQIAIIIVGSPNLTDMLVDRLSQYKSVSDVPEDTDLWPKSIEKLYLARDEKVKRIAGKKILILNGAVDDLVPNKFTIPWMESSSENNDVTFVAQEEQGHALSYEMMQRIVDWLPQWLN